MNCFRLIEQGESFENLAKQYSDDKSSAVNGGKLKPFKSGEINSELFVDTAFSLDVGALFQIQYKPSMGGILLNF